MDNGLQDGDEPTDKRISKLKAQVYLRRNLKKSDRRKGSPLTDYVSDRKGDWSKSEPLTLVREQLRSIEWPET